MVAAFRHDIALHLLLQRVVADLLGRIERAFEMSPCSKMPLLLGWKCASLTPLLKHSA
ncbi:hypothetical protein ACVOMV_23635 [Mesorhizobium atlanticum]